MTNPHLELLERAEAMLRPTPSRTLIDVAADSIDPDVFYDALDQANDRNLVQDNFERALIRELILRRESR